MVNAQSVIPVWINSWRPDFYVSLTDKEDFAYSASPATLPTWKGLFTRLASAINAYKAYNRETEVSDLLFGAYSYLALHAVYGTDGSLQSQFDANILYSMHSFVNLTLSRPIGYYNDLIIPADATPPDSLTLETDITLVGGAMVAENTRVEQLASAGQSTIQSINIGLLFEDRPRTGSINKIQLKITFFTTLHFANLYRNLNVGNLTLPAGV